MNVIISAGGRFHALKLAQQLQKRDSLKKLFTFSYTSQDARNLAPNYIRNINLCKYLDGFIEKSRLNKILNKTKINFYKDSLFDYLVSKNILQEKSCDIFIGWTNYILHTIPVVKKMGAKVIAESGSCHIEEQQILLEQEYAKWGLKTPPINPKTINKMTQEYQLADYIMTLSHFSYDSFIKRGISPKKLLLVPCGCDTDYFLPNASCHDKAGEIIGKILKQPFAQAQDRVQDDKSPFDQAHDRLRQSSGEPQDRIHDDKIRPESSYSKSHKKFRVIFVGLLSLRKGIQYLLDAWNKLNFPEQTTELLLVGTLEKDLASILKHIPIKSNVIFRGPVDRPTLRNLYNSSHLFVLPSIEDGFGMVMGEAMACGLPIICTDHTGGPDLIRENVDGFIVKAGNSNQLAEKILWCYDYQTESRAMGKNGQQHIQNFSWDIYGNNIYNAYKSILGNKT